MKAETDCLLWSINRDTFNATVKEAAQKKRDRYRKFLKSVEVLKSLTEFDVDKISDAIHHYQENRFNFNKVRLEECNFHRHFIRKKTIKDYDFGGLNIRPLRST